MKARRGPLPRPQPSAHQRGRYRRSPSGCGEAAHLRVPSFPGGPGCRTSARAAGRDGKRPKEKRGAAHPYLPSPTPGSAAPPGEAQRQSRSLQRGGVGGPPRAAHPPPRGALSPAARRTAPAPQPLRPLKPFQLASRLSPQRRPRGPRQTHVHTRARRRRRGPLRQSGEGGGAGGQVPIAGEKPPPPPGPGGSAVRGRFPLCGCPREEPRGRQAEAAPTELPRESWSPPSPSLASFAARRLTDSEPLGGRPRALLFPLARREGDGEGESMNESGQPVVSRRCRS